MFIFCFENALPVCHYIVCHFFRYIEIFKSSLSEACSAMGQPRIRPLMGGMGMRPSPYDRAERFGGMGMGMGMGGGGGGGGGMGGYGRGRGGRNVKGIHKLNS